MHSKLTLLLVLLSSALLASCGAETKQSADAGADVLPDGLAETQPEVATPDVPAEAAPEPPGRLRVVHVSDLHFPGTMDDPRPEYLAARVARVNAAAFAADVVVSTGDQVDFLAAAYDDPAVRGPLHLVREGLDGLDAPWLATIGNHETYLSFEPLVEITTDLAARKAAFAAALGQPAFQAVVVNGVRLVLLDTMEGPTWNVNAGLVGSLLPAQIAALDALLADDRPTVLFGHHPPTTLSHEGEGPSLCDVMQAHAGSVLGYFGGHLHSFLKGEACGVPYWAVGNWKDDDASFFQIDVDGAAGTLTVVNEADLPFATPPDITCEPGQAPLLNDPTPAFGTVQKLVVTNTSSDAAGLGQYVGDALQSIPFLLSIDGQSASGLAARLTVASRWADPEGYFTYVDGSPCVPFEWRLDDPCAAAGPTSLAVDALIFLQALTDTVPDPSWQLRVRLDDLRVDGRFEVVNGVPVIAEGVIYARIETPTTLDDLRAIMVSEYCAGRLAGCTPGADATMPACPADAGPAFFDTVPKACDLEVSGFKVRAILTMLVSLPETIHALGEVRSEVVELSSTPAPGLADPMLFSSDAGRNCAP